jgi:hypothetical protein
MFKINTQSILLRSLFSIGSCMALLALMIMPSCAAPSTIVPQPKSIDSLKPNPPLPAYLETLRTTKYWDNKFVGPDYKPSKVFEAFQQASKAGEKIRPEIEQIIQSGTPAGKMYAVVILANFDPEAAKQVLEKMRNDDSVVLERTGDLITPQKVSVWAGATLQGLATAERLVLPPYLMTLSKATRLEGRALGVAATPSQIYQAFEQALQPGKTSSLELELLLAEGTPAGRIYAAMLFVKLDPDLGKYWLERMKSDQTPLTEASGCEVSQTTVGAAVEDILQGRSGVFLPLP